MRREFHHEIDRLIADLVESGEMTIEMLDRAVTSLVDQDHELADEVIRTDDEVDRRYADIQNRIIRLMALQAPVASDLRLIASMFHVNIHVERMGDYALNVARMGKRSARHAEEPELAAQLREMGDIAMRVGRQALTSYAQRDVVSAEELATLDDGVDELNIAMFRRLVRLASESDEHLEWATHMILVARQVERWGDHAVNIGEATILVVTGDVVELSSNAPGEREQRRTSAGS
jgi:phosphate transport system protein